jgi:hypothetical protein
MSSDLWDSKALPDDEAAHKAEGGRLLQAKLAKNARKEVADRAEAARITSMYRARNEELKQKMVELEATEAAATEAFARINEVATAQRLVIIR